MAKKYLDASEQRDELLAALKQVVLMLEVAGVIDGEPEPGSIGHRARAAIRARGQE